VQGLASCQTKPGPPQKGIDRRKRNFEQWSLQWKSEGTYWVWAVRNWGGGHWGGGGGAVQEARIRIKSNLRSSEKVQKKPEKKGRGDKVAHYRARGTKSRQPKQIPHGKNRRIIEAMKFEYSTIHTARTVGGA